MAVWATRDTTRDGKLDTVGWAADHKVEKSSAIGDDESFLLDGLLVLSPGQMSTKQELMADTNFDYPVADAPISLSPRRCCTPMLTPVSCGPPERHIYILKMALLRCTQTK